MAKVPIYSDRFYEGQVDGSRDSADYMVPFLYDLLKPASMLDIGCGAGGWVRAFERAGCAVAHGLDGPWVTDESRLIRAEQFVSFDFATATPPFTPALPQPRYDLVTSFEFAEHIFDEMADPLVDLLTSLSDTIVLGAAIPLQGGTHHVNEQWPAYWAAKFAARGFVACDFIRPALWDEPHIQPWYRQNSVAYFRGSAPEHIAAAAARSWQAWASQPRAIADPDMWMMRSNEALANFENLLRIGNRVGRNVVRKLIGRK